MKLKMDPFHKAKGRIPEMMDHWGLENKRDHSGLPSVSTCHTLPSRQRSSAALLRKGFFWKGQSRYPGVIG